MQKKNKWKWENVQDVAFKTLKERLATASVLAVPDFSVPFCLQTDANEDGLGVVLTQEIDGEEVLIAYGSRMLNNAERNYPVTEKQCLAVVWCISKLRYYLEGYTFTVLTGHVSL